MPLTVWLWAAAVKKKGGLQEKAGRKGAVLGKAQREKHSLLYREWQEQKRTRSLWWAT